MRPVPGRKVVKSKHDFFNFLQACADSWEFGLVTGDELIIGCQSALRVGAKYISYISCLALPRTLSSLELDIKRITAETNTRLYAAVLDDGRIVEPTMLGGSATHHAKHWRRVNFVRRSAAGSSVGGGIPASLRDQRSIGVPPARLLEV
jgi:hypothetical protein